MSAAFTPAKVKADIVFVLALLATFGLNLSTAYGVTLIASAGLIAAAVNLGESLLKKYDPTLLSGFSTELHAVESDASKILPELLPVLEELPGKIGQEVAKALELAEKGPKSTETTSKVGPGK